jgi:hypothetical protein
LLTLTITPQPSEPFSSLVWVHYFLVFAIYIGWNTALLFVENVDKMTKRFFVYCTLAECFGLIIPLIMLIPAFSEFLRSSLHLNVMNSSVSLIVVLSSYHLLVISAFVYVTYFMKLKRLTV